MPDCRCTWREFGVELDLGRSLTLTPAYFWMKTLESESESHPRSKLGVEGEKGWGLVMQRSTFNAMMSTSQYEPVKG